MTKTGQIQLDAAVRHAINRHAVDVGYAPDVRILAARLQASAADIERSLARLNESHGLVLHPNSSRIWIAHPFSFSPTPFWVVAERGVWWANCAWCALGIAAMVEDDARIVTREGGEETSVEVHIRDKMVSESGLAVHFSVPTARWWDNVMYTCGTILFFRSVQEIDDWCNRHRIARGEVLSMDQAWALAQAWYGDYLNTKWRRRSRREAREIFDNLGLTGSFWDLGTWK